MDKIQRYRQIIRQVLTEQAHPYAHSNNVETEIICDTEHDHYQLLDVGWQDLKRIYTFFIHLDIKDGKVWI